MPVSPFDNPMGIDGFEFVEFAAPAGQARQLHDYFRRLGFVQVARHKTRPISTYRRGDCTFLVNEDPDSFAARFAEQHGPSACGFAIRVKKLADWARTPGAEERRRGVRRARRTEQGGGRAGDQGHRRLHALHRRPLRRAGHDPRPGLRIPARRGADAAGLRPDLHRPPDPQPLPRQHGQVGRLLRAAVQLPRDPLLRHQGRQDRPAVQGDDRAGRDGPDPAQRVVGPEVADQRIPGHLPRRGHPAHRLLYRRHLRHGGEDARGRRGIPRHARHLFRRDRPAHPGQRRGRGAPAPQPDPDRRRPGDKAAPAAADLHPERGRSDLLRDHPAQGK